MASLVGGCLFALMRYKFFYFDSFFYGNGSTIREIFRVADESSKIAVERFRDSTVKQHTRDERVSETNEQRERISG